LVASIDPIFTRNSAIRGLTACCDTTVKTIIAITDNAAGFTRLIGEAVRTNRAASNTTPQITPIMCIHHNVYPTIAPDESRLAKIRNAPGATTKLKNTSLPSHKPNARNSTVRKKVNILAPQNRAIEEPRNSASPSRADQRKSRSMTKTTLLAAAIVALSSLTHISVSAAQQTPAAISSDPAPTKDIPPTMDAPDIMSHGSRLNAIIYLASGANAHGTVLLMHGFPGNEQNLDLAYAIRRAGWNVLFPHYRGSWGSAGTFSFSNALQDTQAALDFARDPETAKKYRIDIKKIVLIGHSMGGLMVAYTGAHNPDVAGIAMISAWNLGAFISKHPDETRLNTFYTASPRLAGSTPEGLIAEAKQHATEWNYIDYAPNLKTRPILQVESHDGNEPDNKAIAEALRKAGDTQVTEVYFETDHVYSDKRIALQTAIVNWLAELAPTASK
jgi:pimeloyl-ACP methyl ester carboxylesterase